MVRTKGLRRGSLWSLVRLWPFSSSWGEKHGPEIRSAASFAVRLAGSAASRLHAHRTAHGDPCARHTRRHHHGHASSHQMLRLLLQSPHRHHHRHRPLRGTSVHSYRHTPCHFWARRRRSGQSVLQRDHPRVPPRQRTLQCAALLHPSTHAPSTRTRVPAWRAGYNLCHGSDICTND